MSHRGGGSVTSYARVVEEQVQVLRWSVFCPDHGELLWGARSREEAEDKRFAHNAAHHPGSSEATRSRVFPAEIE